MLLESFTRWVPSWLAETIHAIPLKTTLFQVWLIYILAENVIKPFYNLYFGPLSRFPGPKLAGFTSWYRTYVELVEGECPYRHNQRMHAKYGPVVRVAPNELSFNSIQSYHDIHSKKLDKDAFFYGLFGVSTSSLCIVDPAQSKIRRDLLQPLFLRKECIYMEEYVWRNVSRFCELSKERGREKPVDMCQALKSLTNDLTTAITYGKSLNALGHPDFHDPLMKNMDDALKVVKWTRHFRPLRWMIVHLPDLMPETEATSGFLKIKTVLKEQLKKFQSGESLNEPFRQDHKTLFHYVLDEKNVKMTPKEMYDEAQIIMFAGTDTTAVTSYTGLYHLMMQPDTLAKLKAELLQAWPDMEQRPKYEDLEKLRYLTAFIKEALRLSNALPGGLPRVAKGNMTIGGFSVPDKTIVSCAQRNLLLNEKVFPDPEKLIPERWLAKDICEQEACFIPFSKGPRQCLGKGLAYCMLYVTFASIIRKLDFTPDMSRPFDLAWVDRFVPYYIHGHMYCTVKGVDR